MNTQMLINSLLVSDANSLGLFDIALGLILPFMLSFPATWIYQKAQSSNTYSTAFIHSFFLFASLSSIMTMIIGNNIARAFGLIGALSIIRFRNALKSPIDAVYIFWALAIGMACGTGFYLAAIVLTFTVGTMAMTLKYLRYGEKKEVESIVRINVATTNEEDTIRKIEEQFRQQSIRFHQLNTIFNTKEDTKTYVYQLATQNNSKLMEIQKNLKQENGISAVQSLNSSPSIFVA